MSDAGKKLESQIETGAHHQWRTTTNISNGLNEAGIIGAALAAGLEQK